MATEHKMWAVVNGDYLESVEKDINAAVRRACATTGVVWQWPQENGWRVVPVTVTVPDEGERE